MPTVTGDTPTIAALVTDELLRYLDAERVDLEPEVHPLLGELEALIAAGGKRLRPRFCFWGFQAAGGQEGVPIIRAAAALELLHTFAMISDDVMDASPTRRNRATTFTALAELSAGVPHRGDPKRFGSSAAILTGILGFVLADRLFYGAGFDPDATARAAQRYDGMRTRAVAGQYLDLLAAHRGEADEATARRIGALKSGGYSVSDPLAIGALFATDDASIVSTLDRYGQPLGEAFQIRDDVLGVFGDPTVTGKDRDGDLREGKQTVLLAKARELADPLQRQLLDDFVGDADMSTEQADKLREVIVATGALHETNTLIADLAAEATEALLAGNIEPTARTALAQLATDATARQT